MAILIRVFKGLTLIKTIGTSSFAAWDLIFGFDRFIKNGA